MKSKRISGIRHIFGTENLNCLELFDENCLLSGDDEFEAMYTRI